MNKTVLSSFTIILTFTVFLAGFKISVKGSPELPVHNIDTGLDYATIQEAIDAEETLDEHIARDALQIFRIFLFSAYS